MLLSVKTLRSLTSTSACWLVLISAAASLIPEISWSALMTVWFTSLALFVLTHLPLIFRVAIIPAAALATLVVFFFAALIPSYAPLIKLFLIVALWSLLLLTFTPILALLTKKTTKQLPWLQF